MKAGTISRKKGAKYWGQYAAFYYNLGELGGQLPPLVNMLKEALGNMKCFLLSSSSWVTLLQSCDIQNLNSYVAVNLIHFY